MAKRILTDSLDQDVRTNCLVEEIITDTLAIGESYIMFSTGNLQTVLRREYLVKIWRNEYLYTD
jgi:hypothetical protein